MNCSPIIRGMHPKSFRERVVAQLRFEGKVQTNPEEVQQRMMFLIALKVDAEENVRALDVECVKRLAGAKDDTPNKKKHGTQDGRRERPARPFIGQSF